MPKIEGDIKKRWLMLALVNMVLLLVVYGAIMIGFGFFAVDADRRMVEDGASAYGEQLAARDVDELLAACEGKGVAAAAIENPNYIYAVYTARSNGGYEIKSNSAFIENAAPVIGGTLRTTQRESINGHEFITYTAPIAETLNFNYIKIFAPIDASIESERFIGIYSIPFAVAFLIIGVVVSLVWGYIEIKPVMEGYYKQKSFINDMSHEIRTPLAIIKGNLENITAIPDAKIGDVRESIDECLSEVDYMTDISSGLLNIVKGENKSAKKDITMSDAVNEFVEIYSDTVSISGKSFVASVDSCDMYVDREKVKQLLSILIDNAVKYTREGDRINVKLKNTKDGCVLYVSDTGIGVSKNELELIFDRFYRAENAKDIQGTGLGLAIAKSVVESMNGSIKAVPNIPNGLEIIAQFKRS